MTRRAAPNPHRAEQAAQDLLAGRVPAAAGDLLACIHAVNPTGRSLGAADERRRYELKARLQSMLIRGFHDDLVVTADAPGVVAIRHRYLRQDACHARIDELDDDARARVRWLLDTAEDADPDAERLAAPQGVQGIQRDTAGALAQGRAALDEFDYEAAQGHFERAAVGPDGDPVAARELLALLVDQLALDDQARALEPRLSPDAAGDAGVRALLAIAAARTGDAAAALRLLDGLVSPRASDAWCALAQDAVARAACDDLDRCIARLAEVDPANPEIVRLRDESSRLRAEARRPAEQALVQLAGAGDDAATEASARALLARWPDSAIGSRILSAIQDRRRSGEAERLLARAQAAVSAGDAARAAELARQARGLGADIAALLPRIQELEATQRRARDDADVAAVCAQLADAASRPGLAAFLALEPALRRRVQDRVAAPVLAWLEQAAVHHKATRRDAIIDAVLAIAAAATALDRGDDDHALALLEPHGAMLTGVARANELRTEAHRRSAERRRADAASALDQAAQALAAGDLDACERLCDRADRRELDAASRPRLEHVQRELRARRDLARRRAHVDSLTAAGDLVAARRALEGLFAAEPTAGEPGEAMRARLAELGAELQRTWGVRAGDLAERGDDPDLVGELLGRLPYHERTVPWLVAGGAEVVVANALGRHVFFGRASVDDGRLRDRRALRTPAPLGDILSATVDGDTLWLVGDAGWLLQVSLTTGAPLRWSALAPFLVDDERLERAFLLPGGAHLWLEASTPGGGRISARVIEIEASRLRREIPDSRYLHPLIAGRASCVIGMGHDGGAVRYTERGTVAEELTACARRQVSGVTIDPDGDLVVLDARLDDGEERELEIARIKHGRVAHRCTLPGSSSEMAHRCGAAIDQGVVVVHHATDRGITRLNAFRFAGAELAPVLDVAAPWDLVLAQDADARHVVGLWDSARRLEIARFGAQPPPFGDAGDRPRWFMPVLGGYFSCSSAGSGPDDPDAFAVASRAAGRGDWQDVRARLEQVPLEQVAPDRIVHHRHLLGLAWLRTGVEAARVHALWQDGLAQEQAQERYFTCQLDACLELVEPLPDPLPDAWWSAETPVLRQLRGVIATADQRLAADQPRAALEVLRRRVVSQSEERQSTARLVAAWLAVEPAHPGEDFDKAIALARFVSLTERALDLPIPHAWGADRLAAIAGDAERWLAAWHARR